MADPTPYQRSYSFSDYQADNPSQPLPGPQVDNELENIEQALNGTIDALKDVRRADGKLQNGSVTFDSLDEQVAAGVGEGALQSAEAAANSAGQAMTFRNEAQTARNDAEGFSDLSEAWATGTEPGGTGTKSAREWAEEAGSVVVNPFDITFSEISGKNIPPSVRALVVSGYASSGDGGEGAIYAREDTEPKILHPDQKVLNGRFENGSYGFTLTGGWSVADGKLKGVSLSPSDLATQVVVIPAGEYQLDVEVSDNTLGNGALFRFYNSSDVLLTTALASAGDGRKSVQFTLTEQIAYFTIGRQSGGTTISLDNISIREIVTAPASVQSADGGWWRNVSQYLTPQMFGAVGDGVTDDSAAFTAAMTLGRCVWVPNTGRPYVLSGTIPIYGALLGLGKPQIDLNSTGGDLGLRLFPGGELRGFRIERTATDISTSGRNNNAVFIGSDTKNNTSAYERIRISDLDVIGKGEAANLMTFINNVVEVDVENVNLSGVGLVFVLAHWNYKHGGLISQHPRRLSFRNCHVRCAAPLLSSYGFSLSAVHNVLLSNCSADNVQRPFGIVSGETGGLVADVVESFMRTMTAIRIENCSAYNYRGAAAIWIVGRSGDQVPSGDKWYATDDQPQVSIDGFRATRGVNSAGSSALNIYYGKNVSVKGLVVDNEAGVLETDYTPAIKIEASVNVDIQASTRTPSCCTVVSGDKIDLDLDGEWNVPNVSGGTFGLNLPGLVEVLTLTQAITAGDETIYVEPFSSNIYPGMVIESGGNRVRVESSREAPGLPGTSIPLKITPAPWSRSVGQTLDLLVCASNLTVKPNFKKFFTGVVSNGTDARVPWGIKVLDGEIRDMGRHGIDLKNGSDWTIRGVKFERNNRTDNANGADIDIRGGASNVLVTDNRFNKELFARVSRSVYVLAGLKGIQVEANRFYQHSSVHSNSAAIFLGDNDGGFGHLTSNNWFGPSVTNPVLPASALMWSSFGSCKIGFGQAAPTLGTHRQGDIVHNSAYAGSGTKYWVCTAGGSPGTWAAVT